MAGWTFNRQAKSKRTADRRAAAQRLNENGRADEGADDNAAAEAPLTMNAMLEATGGPASALGRTQQAQLSRLVELEIIPRLMLLHRVPSQAPQSPAPRVQISVEQVHALADLAVDGAPDAVQASVERLLEAGASHEQIFLDLLTPCARWMGELWEQDLYSFSQVTIGLWRLQQVLHELAAPPLALAGAEGDSRRVLLAAVPGSQHTFGVAMAGEFFSRAGWDVACEPRVSWHELKLRASREWFDVFGLSVSSSEGLAQVASGILDIRKAAANPQLFVMVGGPMAACMPDLAQRCGADAMACDAPSAIAVAQASLRRSVKAA